MNQANTTAMTTWTVDPVHTTVGFSVRHLMITNVRGVFEHVQGTVRYDAMRPHATDIHVEVPVQSVSTHSAQRDEHLRGADFFDAAAHPTMSFRSTRVVAGEAGGLKVIGNLTLRGITREAILDVAEVSHEQRDHRGAVRIGASATGTLRRSEFGMTYNLLLEAGGLAIADEVSLRLDLSLVKDTAR